MGALVGWGECVQGMEGGCGCSWGCPGWGGGVEEDARGGDWGYRDALNQVFKAFKGEKRPV